MMVLLTYDVDVTSTEGRGRLRRVAKLCESYGIRVQNSVFEMMIDPAQYVLVKNRLNSMLTASPPTFISIGTPYTACAHKRAPRAVALML